MLVYRPVTAAIDRVASLLGALLTVLLPALLITLTPQIGFAREAPSALHLESFDDSDGGTRINADAVDLEGTLEILHEDNNDGSSHYRHFLSTRDGKRVALEGVQHPDLATGDLVRVKGVRSGHKLQLQTKSAENLEVLQYAPLSSTFGEQKIVILMVNFSNDPTRNATVSSVKLQMANTDAFLRENSYGQTWLSADVFGWYTLPIANTGCSYSSFKTYADKAATAAGVNLSAYTRRVYVFPYTSACGFAGLGTVGGSPSSAWINGPDVLYIINHELGHNLGLYHSHSISCTPEILGPTCTTQEYGDTTDTMGGSGGHYNAFQKQRLGWLGYEVSPPITSVERSGTYMIDAYEVFGTAPKALKIRRGPVTSQAFFFVELRTKVGLDSYFPRAGVSIHLASDNNSNSSYLLDMTPATYFGHDEFLEVGKSFTDSVSGITIRTVSVSGANATITVDLGGTAPSCTRSAPLVSASPGQSPMVQSGTAVTYTVSVTNNDSAECSAASFTLQATVPEGWQKIFGATSVTPNPGTTVSTTLRITSPVVPSGSYTIVGAAISATTSALSGSAAMVYNVTANEPPVPPGPTFNDNFDRPNALVLGNGWSVVTGGMMIETGEARNQPSTSGLAVQPGLVGATQVVAARFASTNNNSEPRFGVVVRYQNAQNYYICYRQVGGSSALRVAKVQNGVQTVLKSVGVANPTVNALSTLSCEASGSTLTLKLDGVAKATTTDATFSTGNAGFAISSKAGTHRADNFSAIVQ